MRVLEAVAPTEPRFVLDLFWRNRQLLDELPRAIESRLSDAGFSVDTLQTSPGFVQLRVTDGSDAVVVDLVAEPADNLDPPGREPIGDAEVFIDSPRAILAEKLCALLERSEIRDLIDIEALVRSGQDLDAALADAPRRDSGFSPLTLAWVLRGLDIDALARSADLDASATAALDTFRHALVEQLTEPQR